MEAIVFCLELSLNKSMCNLSALQALSLALSCLNSYSIIAPIHSHCPPSCLVWTVAIKTVCLCAFSDAQGCNASKSGFTHLVCWMCVCLCMQKADVPYTAFRLYGVPADWANSPLKR